MAIAAVSEAETRLCGNCKKDVPVANFIMHEIHCSRNIEVCQFCGESVPKAELKNHIESEHVQVTCKCGMKMEKSLLKDHEACRCPLRPALCQYCDIQLTFDKLQDHEIYCGARTERCGGCGRNVMVRDLTEHPLVCGREVEHVRGSRTVPRLEDKDGDFLRSEGELEQLKRNENTPSSPSEEWNADLDYVLALSLQNENHLHSDAAPEITSDIWGSCCPRGAVPPAWLCEPDTSSVFSCDSSVSFSTSNHTKSDEVVMLPCEFCEELYPADDLILHQTGCNPASAFASFSKRSSPNPREYHGLPDTGSRSRRSLSSPQLQAVQAEGNIMIPCEFCGVQLEEEMLFHHQHHCDLRPASPAASSPSQHLPAPQSNGERRAAPELARRHSRHQDVSPRRPEGFGQQRLSRPARGPEGPSTRAGSEGRPRSGAARDAAGGTTQRPAQTFGSKTFTPGFSRAPPAQPSPGPRGVSAAAVGRRSAKAKAQSPAGDNPAEQRPTTP